MPASLLDGKALAQQIREELAGNVTRFRDETGIVPGLTVVLVGNNPASQIYVRDRAKCVSSRGDQRQAADLPAETGQGDLLTTIDRLNASPTVHGILVQLPLPGGIDDRAVIERIDPLKDVDGFHPVNAGLSPREFLASSRAPRWGSASSWFRRMSRRAGLMRSCSGVRRSSASQWPCCCFKKARGVTPQ